MIPDENHYIGRNDCSPYMGMDEAQLLMLNMQICPVWVNKAHTDMSLSEPIFKMFIF